jgi:hypothetical protein
MRLLDGTLDDFEIEEKEKFHSYVERLENEELEEGETNPVVYEDMPYFTCEFTNIHRIAFAVADDPFYKAFRSKFYPECIVMDIKGKIKAKINPHHTKSEKYGLEYLEDFREPKLKLNDDKKIRITLSAMKKPGLMILLTVRTTDLRKSPPKEGEFDRAWYRLNNDDTS